MIKFYYQLLFLILAAGAALQPAGGRADDLYWDASPANNGQLDPGAGTWSGGAPSLYWNTSSTGAGSPGAWTNGSRALFNASVAGNSTLSLGGNVSGSLNFSPTVASQTTIGTVVDQGGYDITIGANGMGGGGNANAIINASVVFNGNQEWTINSGGKIMVYGTITELNGPRNFKTHGTTGGAVYLYGTNNQFSGTVTINGGPLYFSKLANGGMNSSLGNSPNTASNLYFQRTSGAGNCALTYTGGGDSSDRLFTIDSSVADTTAQIFSSGTGPLNFTNPGRLGILDGGNSPTLQLDGTYTGAANRLASVISGDASALLKAGNGTWILTGANPLGGATTISGGTLQFGDGTAGNDGSIASPAVTNSATLVFNLASSQTNASAIAGSGKLVKNGPGALSLAGINTYTGTTSVSNGTLSVLGALGNSTVTVASGGTLSGNGVMRGSTTVQSGAKLVPGLGGVDNSTLTVSNNLTLAGNVIFTLNRNYSPKTARVAGMSSVTYGGTLTLTNVGAALQSGDSFSLFQANTFAGSFSAKVLPTLPPGLSWNTNSLTNGIISVTGTATLPTLGITASNLAKTYGQALMFAGTEFSATGLTGGDTVTNVTLTSGGAVAGAGVGAYPIVASLALGTGLSNYNIIYTNGTLTVTPAAAAITLASAQNPTAYGCGSFFAANITPALTGGSVQFLTNGVLFDTQPVVNGFAASAPVFNLPVGTNRITAMFTGSGNLLSATNTLSQVVTLLVAGVNGLTAQYFDNADFTSLKTTRTDAELDFNWGSAIPAGTGLTSGTNYSVMWTGQLQPNYDELYTFYLTADDAARLWVNDKLVTSRTFLSGNGELWGQVRLQAGQRINLRVEFMNYSGNASVKLEWASASQPRQVIPNERLYPTQEIPNGGALMMEHWTGIPGASFATLTNNANYPNQPAMREFITSFECLATNWESSYGTRVTGFIRVPASGSYTFAVSGDDAVQLYLSPNTNAAAKVLIASVTNATGFRDWTSQANQISAPQLLLAGQRCYVELLQKQDVGADHWSVGWKIPGSTNFEIIPGTALMQPGVNDAQPATTNIFDTLATEHPRLMASRDRFTWLRQQYQSPVSSAAKSRAQAVVSMADNDLTAPLQIQRAAQDIIQRLAVAWWVTGNTNYAEAAWNQISNSIVNGDWTNGTYAPWAGVEDGVQAIGYDWLYPYWSQARRDAMTNVMVAKGFGPGWTDSYGNNIGIIINSGHLLATLAVGTDNEPVAEPKVATAISRLATKIDQWDANAGAWLEGTGYGIFTKWGFGPGMGGMETALGSTWGLSRIRGVSTTALEPLYIASNTRQTFTFSDVGTGSETAMGWENWWAHRFNAPEGFDWGTQVGNSGQNALLIPETTLPMADSAPPDCAFRGPADSADLSFQEVVTLRENWTDPKATFVGGMGGTYYSHGMLQSGTFQLCARGVKWFDDLSSESYDVTNHNTTTPNPNGLDRWDYYRNRAEGHNTLVINPNSGPDRIWNAAYAPLVNYQSDPDGEHSLAVWDLTPTIAGVTRVNRGIQLLSHRHQVLVQDEIVTPTNSTVWWFAHYDIPATGCGISTDGSSVTLTNSGERMWLKIISGMGRFTNLPAAPLPTSPNPSENTTNSGYNKLAIQLAGVTNVTLAVWCVPLAPGETAPTNTPELGPLSQWRLLPPGTPLPAAPGSLAAEPAPTAMALTWVDSATNELTYLLERASAPGMNYVPVANLPAGATNFTDTGLTAATTYYYRLRAYAGLDHYSAYASVTATTLDPLGAPLVWSGSLNGNWDINTTANWIQNASPSVYGDGYLAQFDDNAAGVTAVVLTTNVLPGSLTFSNSSLAYTLSSPGGYGIGGTVGMTKAGTNSLLIWNTNTFTGLVVVNAGTLQLGDGTTGHDGSLTANINNNAALVFNCFTDQSYAGNISGTGTLTKRGIGRLTLTSTNNFSGAIAVSGAGILAVGGSGAIVPAAGAALTIGTGGSAGTLQYNSTATSRFGAVTVGNGTTSPGTLNQTAGTLLVTSLTLNNGYSGSGQGTLNLSGGTLNVSGTLVGSSQVANTTTFSTLNVGGNGTLMVSNGLKLTGAPAAGRYAQCTVNQTNGTVTVAGGLTLARTAAANAATRTGIYNLGGGTLNVDQLNQDAGGDTVGNFNFNGGTLKPTTNHNAFLQGLTTAKVQANGAKIDDGGFAIIIAQPLLADGASPGGGLTKLGAGTLRLTGTNTYTGATIVSNGMLQISGALGTGVVSVASGGTLSGSGMVGGAVTIGPGGTLSPGDGVGAFNVSNSVTVRGNMIFELNKSLSPARSNDFILVTGGLTNAGAGTLTISNLGPALVAGDTFTLFSKPLLNGNVLTLIAPAGVTFTNKLALDGSLQVLTVNSMASYSTNLTSSVSGNTLTISWPATHLGWILQSQTNALNIGLGTNWQDMAGTASVTSTNMTIMPATPAAFYRLRHP